MGSEDVLDWDKGLIVIVEKGGVLPIDVYKFWGWDKSSWGTINDLSQDIVWESLWAFVEQLNIAGIVAGCE